MSDNPFNDIKAYEDNLTTTKSIALILEEVKELKEEVKKLKEGQRLIREDLRNVDKLRPLKKK